MSFACVIFIKDAKFRILQPHFMQVCLSFLQLHWQFAHQFLIYNKYQFFPPNLEDILRCVAVRLATYETTELRYMCAVENTLKVCRKWTLNTISSQTCQFQPHLSALLSPTAGIVQQFWFSGWAWMLVSVRTLCQSDFFQPQERCTFRKGYKCSLSPGCYILFNLSSLKFCMVRNILSP